MAASFNCCFYEFSFLAHYYEEKEALFAVGFVRLFFTFFYVSLLCSTFMDSLAVALIVLYAFFAFKRRTFFTFAYFYDVCFSLYISVFVVFSPCFKNWRGPCRGSAIRSGNVPTIRIVVVLFFSLKI